MEKKTQRERLNEWLRYSLDSTQFRLRNAPFFLKFKICSTAKSHFFVHIFNKSYIIFLEKHFCFQLLVFRFFSNFLLSTVFRFFSNFFTFNRFQIFQHTFLLSTTGLKIFQQFFYFQSLVFRFFSNFFAFNRFQIFQQIFGYKPKKNY